jgi:hypothetical protein
MSRASSKFKGVHWDKRIGKWLVQVRHGNKVITRRFNNQFDAAIKYNQLVVSIYGSEALLNNV